MTETTREQDAAIEKLSLLYGRCVVGPLTVPEDAVRVLLLADDVPMAAYLVFGDGSAIEVEVPEQHGPEANYPEPEPVQMSERDRYYYEKGKQIVREDRAFERSES